MYQKERSLKSQIAILEARRKQFGNDSYFTPEETEKHQKEMDRQIAVLQNQLDTLNASNITVVQSDNPSA